MTNADTDLELRIENARNGLRNYGYRVLLQPLPGHEEEFCAELLECLRKVERTVERLHKHARCRGRSKRTLELLHAWLPEPCWGVSV